METNYLNLFYAGISYGQYAESGKKTSGTGLAVRKLGREFPYLMGRGRGAAGRMLIYYALLPQYSKKTIFTGKPKGWKKDTALKLIEKAEQKAVAECGCREQILAPEFGGNLSQVPFELLAVCLYRLRPFERFCVSLPEEPGECDFEQALDLMTPYLPRMKQVVLAGKESPIAERLETWLYEQFGMILIKKTRPPEEIPWLDLCDEDEKKENACSGPENPGRVSRREALKFLDTIVKNGYNT